MEPRAQSLPQRHANGVAHIHQQMQMLAEPADHLPPTPEIQNSYLGWGQNISDQSVRNILGYLDGMLAITKQHPRSPDKQTPSWASRLDDVLRNYRNLLNADQPSGCCRPDDDAAAAEIQGKITEVRAELNSIAYKEAAIVYYNAIRQEDPLKMSSGQHLHPNELRNHLTALVENRREARDDISLPGTRQLTLRQLWDEPDFRRPLTDFINQWRGQQAMAARNVPDSRPQPQPQNRPGTRFPNGIEFSNTIEENKAQESARQNNTGPANPTPPNPYALFDTDYPLDVSRPLHKKA